MLRSSAPISRPIGWRGFADAIAVQCLAQIRALLDQHRATTAYLAGQWPKSNRYGDDLAD
jgi:hypothetical protein